MKKNERVAPCSRSTLHWHGEEGCVRVCTGGGRESWIEREGEREWEDWSVCAGDKKTNSVIFLFV